MKPRFAAVWTLEPSWTTPIAPRHTAAYSLLAEGTLAALTEKARSVGVLPNYASSTSEGIRRRSSGYYFVFACEAENADLPARPALIVHSRRLRHHLAEAFSFPCRFPSLCLSSLLFPLCLARVKWLRLCRSDSRPLIYFYREYYASEAPLVTVRAIALLYCPVVTNPLRSIRPHFMSIPAVDLGKMVVGELLARSENSSRCH